MREVHGTVSRWAVQALADLLDVPPPGPDEGLPLGWHWVHLLDAPRQQDLGRDGHPVRDALPTPPAPGLRRMWAGGELTGLHPLRVGEDAVRRSRLLDSTEKQGRSGTLVFVRVEHEVVQRGEVAVRERQDLVYRTPGPALPLTPAPDAPLLPGDRVVPVSPPLLFRFSALTYNGHRIHYDRDYARDVEGYPGLVTHGPLQALTMAEAVRAHPDFPAGRPGTFAYRLLAPLFDAQGLVVRADPEGDGFVARARDRSGRATGEGTWHPLP